MKNILIICLFIAAFLTSGEIVTAQTSPPYPQSTVITNWTWDPLSTVIQVARSGSWPTTWLSDGDIYAAGSDGRPCGQSFKASSWLGRFSGSPPNVVCSFVSILNNQGDGAGGKKGSGLISIKGVMFAWLSNADNNGNGCELGQSINSGVVWEWNKLIFSEFGYCSFVNFGMDNNHGNYGDDGYVYIVTHDNPSAYSYSDRFVLMRVPENQITTKSAYQFYAGVDNGIASWTSNVASRGYTFIYPTSTPTHQRAQRSTMTYNPGIGRFLWYHGGYGGGGPDRTTNIDSMRIFEAPHPWGPWRTAYYDDLWDMPPGESGGFPSKWFSADGKTVYLVYSANNQFSVRKAMLSLNSTLLSPTPTPVLSPTSSPISNPSGPYPMSTDITGVNYTWTTHRREGIGADNWATTWAGDDYQYSSWGDGLGFNESQLSKKSLGLSRISGNWDNYTGTDIWTGSGKSYGIISLDTLSPLRMYKWVSPGSCSQNFEETVLNKSTDRGTSWTPTTIKFTRAAHDIMVPAILQFGKGYSGIPTNVKGDTENYIYTYFIEHSPNASDPYCLPVQKPGKIYLARVPFAGIENQSAYQFFSSTNPASPTWGTHTQRVPVFSDPNGVGWNMSVSYNTPLQKYLLITEHDVSAKSNMGMFEAVTPWGPWKTVVYTENFGLEGSIQQTAFYYNFAQKWLSLDGKTFTLIFSGTSSNDSWNTVRGNFMTSETCVSGDFDCNGSVTALEIKQIISQLLESGIEDLDNYGKVNTIDVVKEIGIFVSSS
jgi:hypothetical protein